MRKQWTAHAALVRNNAKLWTNIAYVVATWVVIHQEWTGKLDATVFFVWLGVVSGAEIAKRVIAIKTGVTQESK
jgi:hypothetical protein